MKIVRRKLEPVKETQMVSLADIAFLIIFFFLLSAQLLRDKVAVALPALPRAADTESPISVSLDASKTLYLNGQVVSGRDALESGLRDLLAGRSKPEELEVRFKCDKTLPYKVYHPVYEAITNAGGTIAILHEVKKR